MEVVLLCRVDNRLFITFVNIVVDIYVKQYPISHYRQAKEKLSLLASELYWVQKEQGSFILKNTFSIVPSNENP